MAIDDYNVSAILNSTIAGINIAEGCPRENMNDAVRQMMADATEIRAVSAIGRSSSQISTRALAASIAGALWIDADINLGATRIDLKGADTVGKGLLHYADPVAGFRVVQNHPKMFPHFGREELAQLHRYVSVNAAISIGMLGDSNTDSFVGSELRALLAPVAGISVVNYSLGGSSPFNYNSGTLGVGKTPADVKAAGHKCILFMYGGTNDPYQNRTISQFESDLRASIADLRTVYKKGQCSIVMFTGSPIAGTAIEATGEKRDMKWNFEARRIVLKIADEFDCAIFDKAAMYPDSSADRTVSTDGWQQTLDVPGFHTQPWLTKLMARDIFNFLLPEGVLNDRLWYRSTTKSAALSPSTYPVGRSSIVGTTADGWPFDGIVFTDFIPGSVLPFQDLQEFNVDYPRYARRGAKPGDIWGVWSYVCMKLKNNAFYDPPSLAAGSGSTGVMTVTGAAIGDIVSLGFNQDLQGITLTGYVSAANTVAYRFQNGTAGVIDLAVGTVNATVQKA